MKQEKQNSLQAVKNHQVGGGKEKTEWSSLKKIRQSRYKHITQCDEYSSLPRRTNGHTEGDILDPN